MDNNSVDPSEFELQKRYEKCTQCKGIFFPTTSPHPLCQACAATRIAELEADGRRLDSLFGHLKEVFEHANAVIQRDTGTGYVFDRAWIDRIMKEQREATFGGFVEQAAKIPPEAVAGLPKKGESDGT